MMKVKYIPPDYGGDVEITISVELAKLFLGFMGTISGNDLRGLYAAEDVRAEISDVHFQLGLVLGQGSAWQDRGRKLRIGV